MRFVASFGNIFNRMTFCDPNTNFSSALSAGQHAVQPAAVGSVRRCGSTTESSGAAGASAPPPALGSSGGPGVQRPGARVGWPCSALAARSARRRRRSRAAPPPSVPAVARAREALQRAAALVQAGRPRRRPTSRPGWRSPIPRREPPPAPCWARSASSRTGSAKRPAAPGGDPAGAPPAGRPADPGAGLHAAGQAELALGSSGGSWSSIHRTRPHDSPWRARRPRRETSAIAGAGEPVLPPSSSRPRAAPAGHGLSEDGDRLRGRSGQGLEASRRRPPGLVGQLRRAARRGTASSRRASTSSSAPARPRPAVLRAGLRSGRRLRREG